MTSGAGSEGTGRGARSDDPAALAASLREAALRKSRESADAIAQFFAGHADRIAACATAMARAFDVGAKLFAMGNGGSACDAQHVAVEFMHPVIARRAPLPALALPTDTALLSAVANDEDFALGFARQLRALGRAGDIALALSTSGRSANVNRALAVAREMGMLTVGFAGRDGGKMPALCDHCFTVPGFSIHRVQEVHAVLLHVLWDLVHVARGEEDVTG